MITQLDQNKRDGACPLEIHQVGGVPNSEPRRSSPKLLAVPLTSRGGRRRKGNTCISVQNFKNARKVIQKRPGKRDTALPKKVSKKVVPPLKVMQWNAEGVSPKKEALAKFLNENKVDICCVQETHLQNGKTFKIRGYQCIRNDRDGRRKGGIMTLVRNNIPASELQRGTGEAEFLQLKISTKNRTINLVNYYCPDDKNLSLDSLEVSTENFLITGDFNCRSQSWGYENIDKRGEDVEEWQDEHSLILVNDPTDQHTFYSRRWHSESTPDLAFCTDDLHSRLTREVCSQLAGSDHRPVLLSISDEPMKTAPQHSRWNYKKANWGLFSIRSNELTKDIEVEGRNPNNVIRDWNKAIMKASTESIPRGVRKDYKPYWSTDLQMAHDKLTSARENAESNPSQENHIYHQKCKAEFTKISLENKRNSWRQKTSQLNMENETKLWKLVKGLNDEGGGHSTISLDHGGEILTGRKAAKIFSKEYQKVSNIPVPTESTKAVRGEMRKDTSSDNLPDAMHKPITMAELKKAIKKLKKKKSPGPDGITNEMIIHLGSLAMSKLLDIFNLSWRNGDVPQIWKEATMMPILKKGKNKSQALSYRPISLTSCVCKTMERVINSRMQWYLETEHILSAEQAGFRQYRSTEDQTTHLSQVIEDAFQAKKVMLSVFIDLQKAFDSVWKEGILVKLHRSGIQGNMLRWTRAYLHNRKVRVSVNGQLGSKVLLRQGVPQGGVLSPTLFILFINDVVKELPKGVQAALYADDLVLWCSEEYATTAAYRMQEALDKLTNWAKKWCLTINRDKSSATLFTLSTQKPAKLTLGNQPLPYQDVQTYLGVTLDRRLTWAEQIKKAETKARKKLGIMRKLSGTTWGANEGTLKQVYQGTVRPHLEHGSSSFMTAAQTHLSTLEKVQNQGLRIITGAMRSTPVQKMQDVTGIPPLQLRREGKALRQFTKARALEDHPLHTRLANPCFNRLKRSSFVKEAKRINTNLQDRLPREIESIQPAGRQPPWNDKDTNKISIYTTVPQMSRKSDFSKEMQRQITEEMIKEKYPQEAWTHIYTDGSATDATQNGGAGVLIEYPEERKTLAVPTGIHCSNYKAEIEALTLAVSELKKTPFPTPQCVFFTDALSALEALEAGNIPSLYHGLLGLDCTRVTLQWIPAHCDLPGNEEADALAKRGATEEQVETLATYQEMGTLIKSLHRKPPQRDDYHQLSRKEQVIIFRLRTGHCRLNKHMHDRFKVGESSRCPCGGDQTVEHVLQHCSKHANLRFQTWPLGASLAEKLEGSLEALRKTTGFIEKSGLIV